MLDSCTAIRTTFPSPPTAVDQVVDTVMPLPFDRIYSHFYHLVIETDAKAAVRGSAERHKQAIGPGV